MLRRLGSSLAAIVGASLLVFLFLHLVPGDPVDNLAGGDATPDQRAAIVSCMHLDRPLHAQLGLFLASVVDGTLGRQCPDAPHKKPVADLIFKAFPDTLKLALGGMIVAILLALPLGIVAAVRRGTWLDAAASGVSLAGISIPTMWMGPLFIFLFYVQLAWLPGPGDTDEALSLLMPSVVVGTHLMAMLSRMTRSSLLEVLHDDYMQTARAKGLPHATVILKHGLRNALLPVITVAGMQFGALLAGAIITEKIFARPGIGTLIYESIRQRNYPVIQASVLVVATSYVMVNVVVDILYGLADPRIRKA
ncbi:MAG: ABC transporter permease [Deltaproteobacteria bacterium]|nr:ABC transporter permease [Deltaproteobacteria bacterium]